MGLPLVWDLHELLEWYAHTSWAQSQRVCYNIQKVFINIFSLTLAETVENTRTTKV